MERSLVKGPSSWGLSATSAAAQLCDLGHLFNCPQGPFFLPHLYDERFKLSGHHYLLPLRYSLSSGGSGACYTIRNGILEWACQWSDPGISSHLSFLNFRLFSHSS